jgi:uncharacterized protein (DUF2147 family)
MRGPLALLLVAAGAPATAANVDGCWLVEGADGVVELRSEAGVVNGRLVGLADPLFREGEEGATPGAVRTDRENGDPVLRERPLPGLLLVEGLVRDGSRWEDGRIYDPESGRTYSVRAELEDDGRLRIRGYVGTPLLGRTTHWLPASADPETARRLLGGTAPWLPPSVETRCGL